MKKYLLGICAIALAIGFSAFRSVNLIYFVPATPDAANIVDADSYQAAPVSCTGLQVDPCQIDLDLITGETPNVTNEAQLINYLQTNFTNTADRITFLRSISPVKKP